MRMRKALAASPSESPENAKELAALRYCVTRGRPFGDDDWTEQTARRLGLQNTLRRVGRPTKVRADA